MLDKHHTKSWTTADGVSLSAEISPCSWMYSGTALQIKVTMGSDGGTAYLRAATTWDKATEEDFDALCQQVRTRACARCSKPAFDPDVVQTNRDGLCETCFMGDLRAEYEKEVEKEKKRLTRKDAQMIKQGFTHRVDAWVHPAAGGDDFQVGFYFKGAPLKKDIQALLKKEGSAGLDDYRVFDLAKENAS